MKNENALLTNYKVFVLPIIILLFISFTFLYAVYQYLILFLAMFASLGLLIYLCEKSFGYPIPMNYELKNRTLPDARKNIKTLISLANQEIVIVSGTLSHQIYAYGEILELFNKLLKNKIKAKDISLEVYITEETPDPNSNKFVEFLQEVDVPIRRINFAEREKIKHFIIVDSKHVRLEEKHKPDDSNRRAVLRLSTPYLAGKVKKYLNDIVQASNIEILDPKAITSSDDRS